MAVCVDCGRPVSPGPFSILPPKRCREFSENHRRRHVARIEEAIARGERIVLTVPLDKIARLNA